MTEQTAYPQVPPRQTVDVFADVAAFHEKFNVASFCVPSFLPDTEWWQRYGFLHEEMMEMLEAQDMGDFEKVVDAHLDLIYVAIGNLHKMGMSAEQFAACWSEVQRANMAKVAVPGQWKIQKPEGWTPPDLTKALGL